MQNNCTSRQYSKNAQNLMKTQLIVLVKNRKDKFCTSGYESSIHDINSKARISKCGLISQVRNLNVYAMISIASSQKELQ